MEEIWLDFDEFHRMVKADTIDHIKPGTCCHEIDQMNMDKYRMLVWAGQFQYITPDGPVLYRRLPPIPEED